MSIEVENKGNVGNDTIHSINGSSNYGCPQCDSKNVREIGNNHDKTNNEVKYFEFYKCLNCGYEYVE